MYMYNLENLQIMRAINFIWEKNTEEKKNPLNNTVFHGTWLMKKINKNNRSR